MNLFLICLCLSYGLSGHAATVILAENVDFHEYYNARIHQLKPGDTVVLNQRTFALERYLGGGYASYAWLTQEGAVLRLPQRVTPAQPTNCELEFTLNLMTPDLTLMLATHYHLAAQLLEKYQAPAVRLFPNAEASRPPFYVLTEPLEVDLNAKDWVLKKQARGAKLRQEWREFHRQLKASIQQVGDLKLGNIVHVKDRGWLLIDFALPVTAQDPNHPKDPFSHLQPHELQALTQAELLP